MKKIIKLISFVILLGIIGIYSIVDKDYPIYNSDIPVEEYSLEQLQDEESAVLQIFSSPIEELDSLSVKLLVNNSNSNGKVVMEVLDETNNICAKNEIEIKNIKSELFNKISIEPVRGEKNQTYTVKLWCDDNAAVSIYKTSLKSDDTFLKMNGFEQEGTAIIKVTEHCFDLETFIIVLFFGGYIYLFLKMLYRFFS